LRTELGSARDALKSPRLTASRKMPRATHHRPRVRCGRSPRVPDQTISPIPISVVARSLPCEDPPGRLRISLASDDSIERLLRLRAPSSAASPSLVRQPSIRRSSAPPAAEQEVQLHRQPSRTAGEETQLNLTSCRAARMGSTFWRRTLSSAEAPLAATANGREPRRPHAATAANHTASMRLQSASSRRRPAPLRVAPQCRENRQPSVVDPC
jgi:hypothetical protein